MTISHFDCGQGSAVTVVNLDSVARSYFVAAYTPPDGVFQLDGGQNKTFDCSGDFYFDDNGVASVGYVVLPIPQFPYETALMGLAGLLAGTLFAFVISRVWRGKGG